MDRISNLSDDLLVKILSYLPTKVAVSTSVLSKKWEFLWMWSPKLEYKDSNDIKLFNSNRSESLFLKFQRYRDFIDKNLTLHKAPILESLRLKFFQPFLQPEDINSWAGIAVSRCVRELSIRYYHSLKEGVLLLPISLYTCKSLVTLKLKGVKIIVDVPEMACLPSLKTLKLHDVKYSNENSLRLLLSYCPVLEDLSIRLEHYNDNVRELVVMVPSLQRLSLGIHCQCSKDGYVIVTPSLKYFKVKDFRISPSSYLIKHMPELEEADIAVPENPEKLLESITSVKRLTVKVFFNYNVEAVSHSGIVFNQLEYLKLDLTDEFWSRLLFRLLKDSPKLRVLNLRAPRLLLPKFMTEDYKPDCWNSEQSSVPKCLLNSLETFEFDGYMGRPEENDFLSYISTHARCLKSSSILPLIMFCHAL